jgi:hypothetical protein
MNFYLFLNTLVCFLASVRFYHIKYAIKNTQNKMNYKIVHRLNTLGLIFAFTSAFGVTIVGKFHFK